MYVLLSAICFSLGGVLIKSIPWNSLSINMVRSVLSFILIFAYQRTQGRKFVFNKMVLLGAVLNFVMALTFVMATKMTTAANAIVLQFTEPVFLILIVWIVYRQKPKKDAVLTCILVLCGIFCFFFESLSTGGMAGNILAIVSGVTYAGVFLIKKFPGGDFESSLMVSHLISIVVGNSIFNARDSVHANRLGICSGIRNCTVRVVIYIFIQRIRSCFTSDSIADFYDRTDFKSYPCSNFLWRDNRCVVHFWSGACHWLGDCV